MCRVAFLYCLNNILTMKDSFIPDTSAMFSDNVMVPLTYHDSVIILRYYGHAFMLFILCIYTFYAFTMVIIILIVVIIIFNLNQL